MCVVRFVSNEIFGSTSLKGQRASDIKDATQEAEAMLDNERPEAATVEEDTDVSDEYEDEREGCIEVFTTSCISSSMTFSRVKDMIKFKSYD